MSYTQYSQYGGNPYNDASNMEGGRGGQGGYLGQPPIEHEMTNMSAASQYSNHGMTPYPTSANVLDVNDFLGRVTPIKAQIDELPIAIKNLGKLHNGAFGVQSNRPQIEAMVTQIQHKNNQIRDAIKYLETDTANTSNDSAETKRSQVKALKNSFTVQLKAYQSEELNYKRKYQDQIARDYRLVNSEASEEEVRQASEMDWGNEGVFQAALKSNRSGQATSALGSVRARHNELQRVEMTLTELAAMFADMAQIVEAQEPVVQQTEANAVQAQENVDKGNVEISKANESARRRNRLKWWCLLVVVLIILAVALGVGLGVGLAAKATKTVT